MKPHDATAEIRLWGSYVDNKPIPDPYYGGIVGTFQCSVEMFKLTLSAERV